MRKYSNNRILSVVMNKVATDCGINDGDLSHIRAIRLRDILFYVLHDEYGLRYLDIAEYTSCAISSVGHSVNKMRFLMESDYKDIRYFVQIIINTTHKLLKNEPNIH